MGEVKTLLTLSEALLKARFIARSSSEFTSLKCKQPGARYQLVSVANEAHHVSGQPFDNEKSAGQLVVRIRYICYCCGNLYQENLHNSEKGIRPLM